MVLEKVGGKRKGDQEQGGWTQLPWQGCTFGRPEVPGKGQG